MKKYGAYEDGVSIEEQEDLNDGLIEAVKHSNYRDVVEKIEQGASLDAIGVDGTTALMEAIRKDRMKVVELLISEGCNVDQKNFDGFCAIGMACRRGHVAALEALIKAKADVNAVDELGCSCLMDACDAGQYECAKLLIENGAKVNQKDNCGNTELMHACGCSFTDESLINLLLDNGADIDAQNDAEKTPLIIATDKGIYYTVEALLVRGADVVLMDENHDTALNIARRKRYKDIASLIESYEEKNTDKIYGKGDEELKVAIELDKKILDR